MTKSIKIWLQFEYFQFRYCFFKKTCCVFCGHSDWDLNPWPLNGLINLSTSPWYRSCVVIELSESQPIRIFKSIFIFSGFGKEKSIIASNAFQFCLCLHTFVCLFICFWNDVHSKFQKEDRLKTVLYAFKSPIVIHSDFKLPLKIYVQFLCLVLTPFNATRWRFVERPHKFSI